MRVQNYFNYKNIQLIVFYFKMCLKVSFYDLITSKLGLNSKLISFLTKLKHFTHMETYVFIDFLILSILTGSLQFLT